MPRPKRKPRTATSMPLHIEALFKDGTGSERYSDDDIHRLWIAHGEAFARAGGFKPGCWIRNHPASLFALPGVVWTDS